VIFKDFLRGSKIGYELFDPKISVKTTPPLLGGGHYFLPSIPFSSIFSVIDAQRRELHLFFGHHKQWGPPEEMVRNPTLSVLSTASLPYCKWHSNYF
jgi:hypothetical protein